MKRNGVIFFPVVIGLLLPNLILLFVLIRVNGLPFSEAFYEILRRQFASGHNLFLLSLWTAVPFGILTLVLKEHHKDENLKQLMCLCITGSIGISVIVIHGHWSVWYSIYGVERASSTSVIAFLFITIYSTGSGAIGYFLGSLISRWFKTSLSNE